MGRTFGTHGGGGGQTQGHDPIYMSLRKTVAMLTCRLFHITYNAIVLSGKKPKAKPASSPAGIA